MDDGAGQADGRGTGIASEGRAAAASKEEPSHAQTGGWRRPLPLKDVPAPPLDPTELGRWFAVMADVVSGYSEEQRVFHLAEKLRGQPRFQEAVEGAAGAAKVSGKEPGYLELTQMAMRVVSSGRRDFGALREYLRTLLQKDGERPVAYHRRMFAAINKHLPEGDVPAWIGEEVCHAFIRGLRLPAMKMAVYHQRPADADMHLAEAELPADLDPVRRDPARPPTPVQGFRRDDEQRGGERRVAFTPVASAGLGMCGYCRRAGMSPGRNTHHESQCRNKVVDAARQRMRETAGAARPQAPPPPANPMPGHPGHL